MKHAVKPPPRRDRDQQKKGAGLRAQRKTGRRPFRIGCAEIAGTLSRQARTKRPRFKVCTRPSAPSFRYGRDCAPRQPAPPANPSSAALNLALVWRIFPQRADRAIAFSCSPILGVARPSPNPRLCPNPNCDRRRLLRTRAAATPAPSNEPVCPKEHPMSTRTESDTFGPIEVATDAYWGAQANARSAISKLAKKDAQGAGPRARHRQTRRRRTYRTGKLESRARQSDHRCGQEVIDGKLDATSARVWQTGSAPSPYDANEVISNARLNARRRDGSKKPIHRTITSIWASRRLTSSHRHAHRGANIWCANIAGLTRLAASLTKKQEAFQGHHQDRPHAYARRTPLTLASTFAARHAVANRAPPIANPLPQSICLNCARRHGLGTGLERASGLC